MAENNANENREEVEEQLIEALDAWRHNRELYPGWLIAPAETRLQLWRRTSDRIFGLEVADDWSAARQLVLWREIAWRLEACLLPLPDENVNRIQGVLDHLRGILFEQGDNSPPLFFDDESWPKSLSPSRSELRQDFLALQLRLLRSYRVRPNIEVFERCASDVERIARSSPDTIAHLQYQRCLRALAELDRENAREHLGQWPDDTVDPYWLVRKASVHSELGELDTAKSLAEEALTRIRLQRRHDGTGFYALSREGWCRRFLWQIELSENRRAPRLPMRLIRDLERSRCSPDRELNRLVDRLQGRAPPQPPTLSYWGEPDFDSGGRSEAHWLGREHPYMRLTPAIELLFLIEETGVPPVIRRNLSTTVFMDNADIGALSWIQLNLPGIWAAFVLRFGERGLVEKQEGVGGHNAKPLRRATIAALPNAHVRRLFSAILQEIERLVSQKARTDHSGYRDLFRVRDLFDAATRLSYCLGDEEREWALTVSLNFAQQASTDDHPITGELVGTLVRRIVPFLSAPLIQKWLLDLVLRFPLTTASMERAAFWPLITDHVRVSARKLKRPGDDAFKIGVADLIEAVSDTHILKRTDAAVRLLSLHEWGLLSSEETERYVVALWQRTDSDGLPEISKGVRIRVHLEWPRFGEADVVQGLQNWIERGRVEDRFEPSQRLNANGKPRRSIRFPDPCTYLSELKSLSRACLSKGQFFDVFCPKQRGHIRSVILDWWSREKSSYEAEVERDRRFIADAFDRFPLVFEALLLSCSQDDLTDNDQAEVVSFVEDYERMIAPSPHSLMIRATLDQRQFDSFWERVRLDIWDHDPKKAVDAFHCLLAWEVAQPVHQRGAVPQEVVGAVAATLTDLSVAASYGLDVMAILLDRTEDGERAARFSMLPTFVDVAANRLSYQEELRSNAEPEMRSHLRRRLGRLICVMKKCGLPVGDTAAQWLESAKSDPFIDVRRAADGADTA